MMGDDGEKFGAWPTTYEHCWGGGRWVERFFAALEANADWLSTITPSQWLDKEPPIGRVYVPTSSYAEMGEWALPPDETVVFTHLLHDAVAQHRPEARWLRGGFWRNFQVKYREINDLHKQMLRTSRKVAAMAEGPAKTAAQDHLHRGQSNDCYWHGLFGGIYISHMRLATYEHLVAAEDAADGAAGWPSVAELLDLDMDGRPEAILEERGQVVTVKPSEGGGVGSWDVRAARHALAAALRRRPEAYAPTRRRARRTRLPPTRVARPPRSTTWSWSRRRASRAGSTTTTTSVAAASSGSWHPTRRPRRSPRPARRSWATSVTASSPSATWSPGPSPSPARGPWPASRSR
jgi:alpha-amylase